LCKEPYFQGAHRVDSQLSVENTLRGLKVRRRNKLIRDREREIFHREDPFNISQANEQDMFRRKRHHSKSSDLGESHIGYPWSPTTLHSLEGLSV